MNIIQEFDTITAIATPIGVGGVGIIRISGNKSFEIIKKISNIDKFPAGKICHGWIVDDGKMVDEVIVLPFKSPHSYTGEDVIEIQCHGGINVVKNILNAVLSNGARMAERGEFTKRAFLNKKLDLSQAEAVGDLIHAKTSNFALKSARNLAGVLKNKIDKIRKDIFEVSSRIVAGIDFPEDVSEPEYDYLIETFENLIDQINEVLKGAKSSDILRQGLSVSIVGRPNVGKSSLFNSLLDLDRAIVTDIAGTTRDVIKETLDLGVSVTLIDTAGIREDKNIDKVEKIGIEYSKQSANNSDLVIFVYDITCGFTDEDFEIYEQIKNKPHIVVANKIDKMNGTFELKFPHSIGLSVTKQVGIDILKERITSYITNYSIEDTEFITNVRQQDCLNKAKSFLINALEAAKINELQDMIYVDLKSALLSLDELSGEVVTEDILDNIFSSFCIGK